MFLPLRIPCTGTRRRPGPAATLDTLRATPSCPTPTLRGRPVGGAATGPQQPGPGCAVVVVVVVVVGGRRTRAEWDGDSDGDCSHSVRTLVRGELVVEVTDRRQQPSQTNALHDGCATLVSQGLARQRQQGLLRQTAARAVSREWVWYGYGYGLTAHTPSLFASSTAPRCGVPRCAAVQAQAFPWRPGS